MSRYIDADELIVKYKLFSTLEYNHMRMPISWALAYECFLCDLEMQPIADVVEVKHGEWITKCIASSSSGFEWYMHTCSNCGDFYKTVLPDGYKYCHNCGAKMDGERRADDE